jgi:methyltransferase (TIGR00027 family)
MQTIDAVASTAFYCCGVRMLDAQQRAPICGDTFAARFMQAQGLSVFRAFEPLRSANAANLARHRSIDDFLRARLAREPDTLIVLLGCGFDTRAFRLRGGDWLEVDAPGLIAFKQTCLPQSECPNPLQRIGLDFATAPLDSVAAFKLDTKPVIVVVEGVFAYLSETQVRHTLQALQQLWPRHTLVCDILTRAFARVYARRIQRELARLGAHFAFTPSDAGAIFSGNAYRLRQRWSVVGQALAYGVIRAPRWLLRATPVLRDGYALLVLESAASEAPA